MKYPCIALLMLVSITGCQQNGQSNKNEASENTALNEPQQPNMQTSGAKTDMQVIKEEPNSKKTETQTMHLSGQIIYQQMEGGFYSFIAEDGGKYTPLKLPKAHQQHGLIVELEAKALHDVMTIMQFGTVIEVISVKVVDASKVSEIENKR